MTSAFNKDRLYAENEDLRERIAELEQAIMSNCYDDPSTSGKRLMALATQQTEVK